MTNEIFAKSIEVVVQQEHPVRGWEKFLSPPPPPPPPPQSLFQSRGGDWIRGHDSCFPDKYKHIINCFKLIPLTLRCQTGEVQSTFIFLWICQSQTSNDTVSCMLGHTAPNRQNNILGNEGMGLADFGGGSKMGRDTCCTSTEDMNSGNLWASGRTSRRSSPVNMKWNVGDRAGAAPCWGRDLFLQSSVALTESVSGLTAEASTSKL